MLAGYDQSDAWEGAIKFHAFRCITDWDYFIVTDKEHEPAVLKRDLCPTKGGRLEKIGVFEEMGAERVVFDENVAKHIIKAHSYYRFEAKSFNPIAERPLAMP